MEEAKKLFPTNFCFAENAYDACKGAVAVVLMTEWNHYRALDLERIKQQMNSLVFVDLRNVYEPQRLKNLGFRYFGVGRS